MTRSKLGLVGLCAAVFTLTALGATMAQAETNASWLILTSGGVLKTGLELPAEINTEAETAGILHSEIAGLAVLFECTAQSLTGNPKLAGNGSIGTFQVKFSGCLTKLNGITNTFCKPSAGHTESGVIKTLNLDALFGTHVLGSGAKDDVLKLLPVSGNVFADIEMGEECAIGEKVALIGSMALEDGEGLALTHLVKHLLRVFEPLTKLFVNSETAEHAVTLLGSAWASLVGTDAGLKWSGGTKPKAEFIPGGKWLVLESAGVLWSEAKVNEGKASVLLEAETTWIEHAKIAGVAVLFECKKLAAEKAFLLANGSIGESAGHVNGSKVKFSECITKLNGVTSAPCEPKSGGTEKGVITTAAGHAVIGLYELAEGVKDDLISFLPDSGETFYTIEMGAECSIGSKVPLIGKLYFKDCENLALTHLVKHLIEVNPLTELWVISKTAEHVVTLLGSGWASLGGPGIGKLWSGDPN